jgi:hypothetical protein
MISSSTMFGRIVLVVSAVAPLMVACGTSGPDDRVAPAPVRDVQPRAAGAGAGLVVAVACTQNSDCPEGDQCCAGECVSTTDQDNCGACGRVCPDPGICYSDLQNRVFCAGGGACTDDSDCALANPFTPGNPNAASCCNGRCQLWDVEHCGNCTTRCVEGQYCNVTAGEGSDGICAAIPVPMPPPPLPPGDDTVAQVAR